MKRVATVLVGVILLVINAPSSRAYEVGTHGELAQRAVDPTVSSLDEVLRTELGMPSGIAQQLLGRDVRALIGDGARLEDLPSRRALNHFHNPLREPWDDAGLRTFSLFGVPLIRGQSSALWQQNPAQDTTFIYSPGSLQAGGGNWSWKDARARYLAALTSGTKEERERAFAQMFLTLGHLTHLIQDASVPAHTRNDPHLLYEGYEAWVEAVRRGGPGPGGQARRALFLGLLNRDPVLPTLSFSASTGHSQAPVPIARLLDANSFEGLNVDALQGTSQGLAEYTNGNFMSDDTIFRDFQLPRPESLGASFEEPEGRGVRQYFPKDRDGEPVRHFVAVGTWAELLQSRGRPERNDILTDRVYQDYAELLVPRAVGYSAGLLDYFFRGKLDFYLHPDRNDPAQVNLVFWNNSAETMTGSFTLYTENKEGRRVPVPGASVEGITLSGTETPDGEDSYEITFTPDPGVKLGGLTLVFSGTLGAEEGAVAGKVQPWEPILFAVQELAEFTEPARVNTYLPELIPEDEGWAGSITRSNDPSKQRAKGYFYASEEPMPGRFIKSVWVWGATGTRLLLNGVDVGQMWSRESGPPLEPATWEVIIAGGWSPSYLALESTSGQTTFAPLTWWRSAYSEGSAEIYWGCCNSWCTGPLKGSTRVGSALIVSILFGDYTEGVWPSSQPYTSSGYVPLTSLGGYAPGTVASSGEEPLNYNACSESGDYTWRSGIVFASISSDPSNPIWNESFAWVGEGHLTFGPRPDRTRPPIPTVPEPSALPTLVYKRSYRPDELLRYGFFGITPPEYQLELR